MTLVPTVKMVKDLHDVVIKYDQYKAIGVTGKGSIEAYLDRPFTIYGQHEIYPGILTKAAVLLHSFAGPFHPFIEGNKRTAILLTDMFLWMNGYSFNYPRDVVGFLVFVARGKIRSIRRIEKWIRNACTKNELYDMDDDSILSMFRNKRISLGQDVFPLELRKK